jgi:hypothetical protein
MRALGAIVLVAACSSSKAPAPATAAAGKVVEVSGAVTVAGKPLHAGDTVASNDTIDTGADGAVVIELAHNHVRLDLGPNKHVRVDQSVAWSQPMKTDVADQSAPTTSAGRAAERSAADTSASTTAAPERTQAPEQAPPAAAADTDTRAAPAEEAKPEKSKAQRLGVTGTGEGGGGIATGSGLGSIGSIGHGDSAAPSTSVKFGAPTINGPLDAAVVTRVLRGHVAELRVCYTKALAADPSLGGTFVLAFEVDKTGKVSDAVRTSGSLDSDPVEKCVLDTVRSWTFPTADAKSLVFDTVVFAR